MSSYALSLLTNRQLIIDITAPCDFQELLAPNEVNWSKKHYKLNGLKRKSIYCIDSTKCTDSFNEANTTDFELDNDIITIQLNNDWLEYFSGAKNFQSGITKLGYQPDKFKLVYVMHKWYSKLFKLTPHLQDQFELFLKNSNVNPQTFIVCAQIRIGGARPNVPHDSPRNHLNSTKLFWSFIRENYIANFREDDDWKFFITTDIEVVEKEAIEEFGSKRVIHIPGVFSHVDMEPRATACSRVEKPILDFHFLQNCDKAAVSWSGFGKLGAWNRVDPIKDLNFFLEGKWHEGSYNMTVL